jgi:hypothetical protein
MNGGRRAWALAAAGSLSIFASHNRSSAGTQFHSAVVITAMNLPSLTPQPVDARAEREHKA